jgi:hypothetical protein
VMYALMGQTVRSAFLIILISVHRRNVWLVGLTVLSAQLMGLACSVPLDSTMIALVIPARSALMCSLTVRTVLVLICATSAQMGTFTMG